MSERKGKIVCTRIVHYDEVSGLLGSGKKVQQAVDEYLKTLQESWIKTTGETKINEEFLKLHFPVWEYFLNDIKCTPPEVQEALKEKTVWDIFLSVDLDSKLKAYKIIKNES